jgi:hypothetical protein
MTKNLNPNKQLKLGLFLSTRERDFNRVQSAYWIRALQLRKYYEKLGLDVRINEPWHFYDVAIYFRENRPKDLLRMRLLKLISKQVYWDTVVDYFQPHETSSTDQVRVTHEIAKKLDGIICSTQIIADSAKRFSPNVIVMRDPIDLAYFTQRKASIQWTNPEWIWSGVSSKAHCLNPYKDLISGKTHLVMDTQVPLEFEYSYSNWRHETFAEEVMKGDIALLPRTLDSPYNRGHSCFKALPFAVSGIPILASRIPSYVEMSQYYDGICFLEDYPNVESAIADLKTRNTDPTRVREHYSCETISRDFIQDLESRRGRA